MRQAALQHLMTLSSSGGKKVERAQLLTQKAYNILEAFGHCRTLGNSNATRFGGYVELQLNERGKMIGAKFLDYFLERSRVTDSDETTANFHVFYYLVHDKSLQLPDNGTQFRYLYKTKEAARLLQSTALGTSDHLLQLKADLKALGINKATWTHLIHILAAILYLGNIQFQAQAGKGDEVIIRSPQDLETAAQLLGVEPRSLENVLKYQTKLIKSDMVTIVLDAESAVYQRDALAQTLYSLVFTWIVEVINKRLCKATFENFVGLLDFPGLDLGLSTFDQFCINFSNEKVHQYILDHPSGHLFYSDNNNELPAQTLSSALPSQEQPSKASRVVEMIKDMQHYQDINDFVTKHQLSTKRQDCFAIQHFGGLATYKRQDFDPQKTMGALNADFVALSQQDDCTNPLLQQLFEQKTVTTTTTTTAPDVVNQNQSQAASVVAAQQSAKPRRQPSVKRKETVAAATTNSTNTATRATTELTHRRIAQVNDAMDELFTTVGETQTWWVLCFKPNDLHLPSSCDAKKLASQLQVLSVSELTSRARNEYTIKMTTTEFCERYGDMAGEPTETWNAIIHLYNWDTKMMAVEQEQVYLHGHAWMVLENKLRAVEKREQRRARCIAKGIPFVEEENESQMGGDEAGSCVLVDTGSVFSDDHCFTETGSVCTGLQTCDGSSYSKALDEKSNFKSSDENAERSEKEKSTKPKRPRVSKARGCWVIMTWLCTWWIPSALLSLLGGMRRQDIRMAWREKLTLCMFIFILCAAMIWFICFFGRLLCPHQDLYTQSELQARSSKDNAYVAIRGEVFDLTSFAPRHWASEVIPTNALFQYSGQDISDLFPVQVSALCDGNDAPVSEHVTLETRINITDSNAVYHDFRSFRDDYRPDWYFEQMVYLRKNYRLGFMGYDIEDIRNQAIWPVQVGGISTQRRWAILHNNVYDLTSYMLGGVGRSDNQTMMTGVGDDFIDNSITELFRQLGGTDISAHFDALPMDKDKRERQLTCLRNLFFVGKVDTRNSPKCLFSEYLLLLITVFLCSVILFKFLAALCLTHPNQFGEEQYDKFIVCQVPCYTEGEESLRKTIDSVAALRYDDKRKLLFLIADGMIVGSGNDRSTPKIVLDILGVDTDKVDPKPVSFLSLGQGQKQHNMAKVYSGLYEHAGHVVPYIVVVKVGTRNERQKAGNRGKRDSQMVLMRFLNKVHHDSPMTPVELEIYHELKNVIGVHPSFYELVLMIDADTEVMPDALNRMVGHFVHDPKIVGLCGETMLSNEKDTWVTMIQVYEYYISHYLSKAFESLFGSVTCLPGCFCMYRVRSIHNKPLLVSNQVINDYAEINVDTLHKKNLLHLGEDRYLTTLILKHFPNYKTKFTADAACMTNAPDRWPVLLSQRRRWINSTIHNLGELMFLPQLCGFCCFSMRFVVMLDLLSTLVMPAVVCYLIYLIYQLSTSTSQVPLISIITLAGVYGLQAIIFILRRKWEHIGWMIVYILAIPVFSFLVPIYAFWHFDDFSWGNTRIVVGEGGQKKAVGPEEAEFDPSTIPTKRWEEHEQALMYIEEQQELMTEKLSASECCNSSSSRKEATDQAIREAIEQLLDENDLMVLTKKQVRDALSHKFEVDMSDRREFINKCIEHSLGRRL
ncbi:chitin synthase-domain-containing protein [Dichotomocladium elegans]|nr:chitin synthase-domain-containing protein [Dichotomocladium elegans]